jgi:hypothetical protein
VGQHSDALGTIENFKAPWETDAGEVEIDKARLKRYVFNLALDKAKAQDARDESAEKVKKTEQELETAKADAAKNDPDGKVAALEKKLTEAQNTAASTQLELDRLEVGIEKGLTPKQAKRLTGTTKDELDKDAEAILEEFGVKAAATTDDDDDDDKDDDEPSGRTTPRRVVNPLDPNGQGAEQEPDYEKIADQVASRRF